MRIVYLGTPDDAVPPLEAIVAAGHEVALVVTPEPVTVHVGDAEPAYPFGYTGFALLLFLLLLNKLISFFHKCFQDRMCCIKSKVLKVTEKIRTKQSTCLVLRHSSFTKVLQQVHSSAVIVIGFSK